MAQGDRTVTPTLMGRWQTRLATFLTLGLLVSLLFVPFLGIGALVVILYLVVLGLLWDVLWIALQRFRWDRDWPTVFQWGAAIVEGLFFFVLAGLVRLPGLNGQPPGLAFAIQYLLVFLVIFCWLQGPMRALFPFWRYHGGRIAPAISAGQRR